MTITAKYPTICASCHAPIHPGQRIEWTRGEPARHTSCPAATSGAPQPQRRRDGGICAECEQPRRHLVDATDACGILARICPACARNTTRHERSFA